MYLIALFLAIGILTGLLSSMFGFGGGFVVIPVLYLLLPNLNVPDSLVMHVAVGTSLAVMIVNAINSTISHHRKGHILWFIFLRMAPGIACGALIGGVMASFIGGNILRYLFILFMIYTIASSLIKKTFVDIKDNDIAMPDPTKTSLLGGGIGFIATLLGVGGSVIIIPFLRKCQLKMINAVSLATPLSLPVAVIGTITSIWTGMQEPGLPPWCLGFVYIPAFIGIVVGGFIGVPIGTRIAHHLPDRLFSKIYLALLIVVVMTMIFE
ncbi:sulfite exporter TauE/SafE family protein [Tuberibacillus sp. Marseille-P3662]|uniref:sulfite exporter TauE/SafE family protein n=1 Tax=Tuberibacillus sp. Marseille-P3662 TaxID=1965358 RepID=UPI000A1C856E|nr:sulfite exporter TauE/SafE family protein [Tuberibacillus sp. Marseille-P3662]